jgi:1-acyl-sn-glycerol-3-phosphate acyltransferase
MKSINYYLKRPVEKIAFKLGKKKFWQLMQDYIEISLRNPENLPKKTSAIAVPNHEIGIDGVVLSYALSEYGGKQSHFLVQNEGVYNGSYRFCLWATGQIPVNVETKNSNRITLRRVEDYLAYSKDIIGIFSEGPTEDLIVNGRMIDIEERKHNVGAAHFAIKMKKPIIPIAIQVPKELRENLAEFGSGQYNEKMNWLRQYTARHGKFPYVITLGIPVEGTNKKRMTEEVRQQILKLYRERDCFQ